MPLYGRNVGVIYQSAKELRNECQKDVEEREKGLFWTDDYINPYSGLKQQCAAKESGGSENMINLCFNFRQRPNTKGEIMTQLEYPLSVTNGFRSWKWNLNKVYNREDDPTPVIGLHGVLFVGYRLNRNTGELDVLLMNSWLKDGTSKLWAEDGFAWIRVRNAAAAGIIRPIAHAQKKRVKSLKIRALMTAPGQLDSEQSDSEDNPTKVDNRTVTIRQ
ncbi:hypothetical protein GPALN_002327 [Globodera pallida]|nr:hypothetical protein GPALN_002327 [Globodera pallida]